MRYIFTASQGSGELFLRVCLLASGSKGNAVFIEAGETRLLIDVGLSAREIERRLSLIGVEADSLHAILVTHEHSDHVQGAGPMARRFGLPLCIHPETHNALPRLGKIEQLQEFEAGTPFHLRDLEIKPFSITHDASAPVGFVIESTAGKIGVATDLGIATRLVAEYLKECRVLVLESNHDEQMLLDGPYPWHLKQRIKSSQGHLSNNASAELLDSLLWEGLDAVFLAHLSETNNEPAKAHAGAFGVLNQQNLCDPHLALGTQENVSFCFEIES
jgi:phosphoribosyl 1,2-cyclic phosphodiesterase